MNILNAYGIPTKLLSAIEIMHENTRAKVISPDGETDFFEIKAGVLQGDTLAIVLLDYVMQKKLLLEGRRNLD